MLLLLSVSSSSPPPPPPLLHLGDKKKLQPLTFHKLFAAAATGPEETRPARAPLSVFFSSVRDGQRPVRLNEALQHFPISNKVGVLRKRTFPVITFKIIMIIKNVLRQSFILGRTSTHYKASTNANCTF